MVEPWVKGLLTKLAAIAAPASAETSLANTVNEESASSPVDVSATPTPATKDGPGCGHSSGDSRHNNLPNSNRNRTIAETNINAIAKANRNTIADTNQSIIVSIIANVVACFTVVISY